MRAGNRIMVLMMEPVFQKKKKIIIIGDVRTYIKTVLLTDMVLFYFFKGAGSKEHTLHL